ncbi:MAG: DUF3108 domain-containing protein [Elusimicrobiota bacterium]
MKIKIIILLFISVFVASAQDNGNFIWRKEVNKAFKVKEILKFSVGWGPITAGVGKFEVIGEEEINGRKAYHITAESYSLPFFDAFYRVRNKDESWMDIESLCTLRYEKHQNEANHRKEETIVFNHSSATFELTEVLPGKDPVVKKGAITPFVQDIISAMFYLRTRDIKVGGEYFLNTVAGDKNYALRVVVHNKEKVRVPAGKYNCFVVEPFIEEDVGIFKAKGRLWVWLTDDHRKMPVMMKSKIFVGYISAVLTEFKH